MVGVRHHLLMLADTESEKTKWVVALQELHRILKKNRLPNRQVRILLTYSCNLEVWISYQLVSFHYHLSRYFFLHFTEPDICCVLFASSFYFPMQCLPNLISYSWIDFVLILNSTIAIEVHE